MENSEKIESILENIGDLPLSSQNEVIVRAYDMVMRTREERLTSLRTEGDEVEKSMYALRDRINSGPREEAVAYRTR